MKVVKIFTIEKSSKNVKIERKFVRIKEMAGKTITVTKKEAKVIRLKKK